MRTDNWRTGTGTERFHRLHWATGAMPRAAVLCAHASHPRQALYDLVWAKPAIAVAKDVGVSGNHLARVCVALNVAWPPTG